MHFKEKEEKLVDLRINLKIGQQIYDEKYDVLELKLKELKMIQNEIQLSLEGEASLVNRIKNFKKIFNTDEKMDEFDRVLFESLVEKVVVGKEEANGNPLPYSICFILKTGLEFDENVVKSLKKRTKSNGL